MKLKLLITSFALALFTIAFNSSCQKKTDCKLIITTKDSSGATVIGGATIKLFADVKTSSGSTVEADLKAEGVSDGGGQSSYTFKLPAILDIKAVSGSMTGVGIVKLEEGKTVEKVINMK